MARLMTAASWLMYGFIISTGIIALVMAIVLGIRSENASNSLARIEENSISVILNDSCTSDRFINPRRAEAYQVRLLTAFDHYATPVACHETNGDEALYAPVYFSQFSKGMLHDSLGHVNPAYYASLLNAVNTRTPSAFNGILQAPGAVRDFTNPQASMAFTLQGADPQSFHVAPPPEFASAEQAGEMVENYWMAYTRDVDFANYATDPKTLAAVAELNTLSDFRGLKPVTPANLFRGLAPGCVDGPYLSQFFYLPCVFGANVIDQRIDPPVAGVDFMTNFTTYLAQQNAQTPEGPMTYTGVPRFMKDGRDLAHWVHIDVLFQAYFHAMLCLLHMHAPLKPGIPYQITELNQMGFGTFGGPDISAVSTIGATAALKAVWFSKWLTHRRLRPEVFGARVHNQMTSVYTYPIHADVLGSSILGLIYAEHGSYLLPQAFPEGSPLHPSYGAGHATVAGTCVTMLKAFFQEDYVIPGPLMPNPADGGQTLIPLSPSVPLTVGGELNKLANNVGIGRNIASVHWRSDATESFKLGEQVAIELLRDLKQTYSESFEGFTFTDFEGVVQHV
jgi:hypothetical protein